MVYVIKHSGEREVFDPKKVEYALIRSGAPEDVARDISEKVGRKIHDGVKTGKVFKLAFDMIDEHDFHCATRFGLKIAIMRLGPTGYPFEQFVSRILTEHNFMTQSNQLIEGCHVTHEVDVVAEKEGERFMIECKYHNQRGMDTGLKETMYTWARFDDLVEAGHEFTKPWIITNTKITTTAIDYGLGKNMRMTAWSYPDGHSLQEIIEKEALYPITILRTVTDEIKNKLAEKGIVLIQDLEEMDPKDLSTITGIPLGKINNIEDEVKNLCLKKVGHVHIEPD